MKIFISVIISIVVVIIVGCRTDRVEVCDMLCQFESDPVTPIDLHAITPPNNN